MVNSNFNQSNGSNFYNAAALANFNNKTSKMQQSVTTAADSASNHGSSSMNDYQR